MKKTFRYLLLLGALTGFASCLDEVPYGTYSNETFYNTEADAESALMYAYVPINYIDYCGRFLFFLSDVPTNQYKSYGKADESPLFQWDITPTSDEAIYFFKSAYVSLARTNSVLENVSRMTSISAMARNRILGEAHFLRAFNHFMLVINYGSVPIRSKTVSTVSDSYKDFAPIEKIYGFIIGELEEAIGLLPVNKVQGRADKVAAQALLARDRKIRGLHRRRRQRHERDAPLVERPVEHHAHGIEVALGRDLRAAQHLRRHEIVCVVHGGKLRHAEVAELIRDLLVEVAAADKDVARLDIAVHDAAAMARLQRAAQTGAELDDVRLSVRMVAQVVRQGGQQLRAHIDVPAAAVRVLADDVILAPQQIRLIADGIDRHELPRDRLHLAVEQGGHFLRRAALGDEGVKVLRRGGDRQHLQRRVIHHAEAVVARNLVHRPVGVSAECTYRFPVLIVQIAESFFHVRSAPPSISG